MKAIRKKRLTTVLFLLLTSGLGTILIIKALDSNLDFFFTPSEIFAEDLPENNSIKVGGMVLEDSVVRDGTNIVFQITDYDESIEVEFNGIVPALFQEGSGVVVLGYLFDGLINAEKFFA